MSGAGGAAFTHGRNETQVVSTLRWLVLPQTIRAFGAPVLLVLMLRGELPPAFSLPIGLAFVVGALAPIVARGLSRGGLLAWAGAIAWTVGGLLDFVVGWTDVLIMDPAVLRAFPMAFFPRIAGPILALLHVWSLAILVRPETRALFVSREAAGRAHSA